MNALTVLQTLSQTAFLNAGEDKMPPADLGFWETVMRQWGPAGLTLCAACYAGVSIWKWGSPLLADRIKARTKMIDAAAAISEQVPDRLARVESSLASLTRYYMLLSNTVHRKCAASEPPPSGTDLNQLATAENPTQKQATQ